MATTMENPYVGPRTFLREERHLFFGRDREARDLSALVASEKLVLFYAQSGAGKSSLINTCLIPELVENLYEVLPIARVSGEAPEGIEIGNIYIYNLMRSLIRREVQPHTLASLSLSQFLGRLNEDESGYYYDGNLPAAIRGNMETATWRRALIIDQFEELFSTHQGAWEKREDFFKQLAQAMQDDPYLWVVLVMREDYIAALDPYAHLVAGGLRVRYYMQRLSRAAAIKAVRSPAEKLRPYAEGVAEDLVENLASVKVQKPDGKLVIELGQYVEPVQMQVVCYSLWENLPSEGSQITEEDLREVGDINQALEKFYDGRVGAVAREKDVEERLIREWFNNELITIGGIRNMVLQSQNNSGGLSNAVIQALQGDLVRAEMRAGQLWYELSHDRLIEPIQASNAKWFAANLSIFQQQAALWEAQGRPDGMLLRGKELEQAKLEAASKTMTRDERDFLAACSQVDEREQREKRANRLVRILAIAASLAFIAAIFLAISANIQAHTANIAEENAVEAVTAAANALSTAQSANTAAASANGIIEADKLAGQAQIALSQSDSVRLGQLLAVFAYKNIKDARSDKFLLNVYQALFDSVAKGNDLVLSSAPITSAAFSPDVPVKWLITDNSLWNLEDGQESKLAIESGDIIQTAFQSNEEVTLVVRDFNYYPTTYTAYIINTVTQSQQQFPLTSDFEVSDIYLSNNGHWLITQGFDTAEGDLNDKGVQLWNIESLSDGPRSLGTVGGLDVRGVAITGDGKNLAVTDDTNLYIWGDDKNDILSGTENTLNPDFKLDAPPSISSRALLGDSGRNLQYSPDGQWLALRTANSINIYDLRSSPRQVIGVSLIRADILGFRFSPDNKSLIYVTSSYLYCENRPSKDCQPSAVVLNWPLGKPNPEPSEIYKSTTSDITAMDISRNGKLVIADEAGYVRAWDIGQDSSLPPLVTSAHPGEIDTILIAPDNLTIISSSREDGTRLWKLTQSGIEDAVIVHRISNTVSSVVRSEDGNVLAIGGINGEEALGSNIHVYSDLQTPTSLTDIPFSSENGNNSNSGPIAISNDWILAARTDGYFGDEEFFLDFWKRNSDGTSITFQMPSEVSSMVFYPDGAYLIIAANTGPANTAELWINETTNYLGKIIESLASVPVGSPSSIQPMPVEAKILTELRDIRSLQFTRNGDFLIGASMEGVHVWNMRKNTEVTQLENATYPIIMSPDQKWLITAALDNTVQFFSLENVAKTPVVILPVGKTLIDQFAFNQDGDLLAVSDKTGKISIYEFPVQPNPSAPVYTLRGSTSEINWLEFSPKHSKTGDWLVASSEQAVFLWDLANPDERPIKLQGYKDQVIYAGFTNDSEWIVTAAQDRTLRFWSLDLEKVSATVCKFAGRNLKRAEWIRYIQQAYIPENADTCGYELEN